MLNSEDFIKRLENIFDYYGLNASSFADKIGVQRSSISHLLSGRNKPSLDFVMKIIEVFPDLNLYWILNGKEEFLKNNEEEKKIVSLKIENQIAPIPSKIVDKKEILQTIEKDKPFLENRDENTEIFKIVIFYKNGTFKDFTYDTF